MDSARTYQRINAVIEALLANWQQWEAEAGQQAQQDQDYQSYHDVMFAKLYPLLAGLATVAEVRMGTAHPVELHRLADDGCPHVVEGS